MNLWERLMLWFFPSHHPSRDLGPQVEAALQRAEDARRETDAAAVEATRAAHTHTAQIQAERVRIQQRTEHQRAKAHPGQTSGVRIMVDDMLRSYQPRNSERN